jgi:hypothetical protein
MQTDDLDSTLWETEDVGAAFRYVVSKSRTDDVFLKENETRDGFCERDPMSNDGIPIF